MEAIICSKPIVYGKPIVFNSNVVFPCVSNNFRGTQLTWQYCHRHRRRLGFMCYHHHHQLKLVAFKETPATQIVKPTPKPKRKLRLVEKLLLGALAVSSVGFWWFGFVIMPQKEMAIVRPPSESSIPYEFIYSKLEQENQRITLPTFLSLFCCTGLLLIQCQYEEVDESEYEIRLAFKIAGAIFLLGFVTYSVQYLSIAYTMDTLIYTLFRDWNGPSNLFRAMCFASLLSCCPALIAVQQHYDNVDDNDSEKGLDFKVFGVMSMGLDVACSTEFMSIAYTMDTLSRTVFRNWHWHWPYNISLSVVFILVHICCRGLRAVIDLHHKHSRLPECENKSFNKRSSKQTRRLHKKSSRRRTNRQKKYLEKTTPVVEVFLQKPTHRSSNLCDGLQDI